MKHYILDRAYISKQQLLYRQQNLQPTEIREDCYACNDYYIRIAPTVWLYIVRHVQKLKRRYVRLYLGLP